MAASLLAQSVAPAARAEPPPGQSDDFRAETLFREGEKKFDAGKHVEACAAFQESLRLGPKLGTLLNLGLCHETVGKLATAWREFLHASAWAAQNNQKDRHEFARQHLLALEPRLPRVLLKLPFDRALASLEIDGEPVPEQRWNLPIYLDPGEHAAAITAPGKRRTTLTFRVTDAPTEQLVVVPSLPDDDALVTSGAPARRAGEGEGRGRVIGFGLVALGGATAVAGLVTGGLALTREDASTARGMSTVSYVSFATSAVLVGVGSYLLFASPAHDDKPAKATRARGLMAGAAPVPGGAAVGLAGTF